MTVPALTPASSARRRFLVDAGALAAGALMAGAARAARINPPALLDNQAGGYRVLPAGQVFCGGVIPNPGYEIVHALFNPWVPLDDAWGLIEAHLKSLGRPVQALCGMELRIPQQLTVEGFRAFNAPYVEHLRKRDLLLGNYSAVCRTNVAPGRDAPKVPSLHAFSYCLPGAHTGTTFCVSGTADIDARGKIVAEGDVSAAGMRARLQHCVDVITERLAMLELDWSAATHIDLCVVEDIPGLMDAVVVPGLQGAASRGVRVHVARPPIIGAEVELECRGVRQELVLRA
ncbi:MAG TPA: hypothetical protein VD791_04505 [Burkholderiales bacterium]|nr:hypothetical protein [Burkholderiales bacterium]